VFAVLAVPAFVANEALTAVVALPAEPAVVANEAVPARSPKKPAEADTEPVTVTDTALDTLVPLSERFESFK